MSTPEPLTIDEFKKALPEKVRRNVNKDLLANINSVISEPEYYEFYRENLLNYAAVMKDGKFKIQNYLDAVKYVSHKLMGHTNIEAYRRTYPHRIQDFTNRGLETAEIHRIVSGHNKSKLVMLLLEQTMVPTWVLNQDLYQKALNVQADLMTSAKSEKVRSDAANSILTQLKQPETQQVELNIGMKEDSSISQLRQATLELVAQQKLALQAGAQTAEEIAESAIVINGEAERVE